MSPFKVLLVICLSVCSALTLKQTPAAKPKSKTPQEKVLAEQAVGNFACKVNSMTVSTESPGDSPAVQAPHVRAAFQSVATLEWAHAPQMSFSATDGRNDEKVLATPGGDMGEFIQALMAYGKVSKSDLTQEQVNEMFTRYIKTMTAEKFTYETDEKSYVKLAIATGCRNLRIAEMAGMKRKKEALLEQIGNPEFIGDPFIKFLATNGTALDLDTKYISMGLAAYHTALWGPTVVADRLCYIEVKGPHREAALVDINVPPYCIDQGLVPMVSQQLTCAAPVFIRHKDAVKLLRRTLVASMTEGAAGVDPRAVLAQYNQMAENNFESWWGGMGSSKARYSVSFSMSTPLLDE